MLLLLAEVKLSTAENSETINMVGAVRSGRVKDITAPLGDKVDRLSLVVAAA